MRSNPMSQNWVRGVGLLLLGLAACTGPRGATGQSGESCTIGSMGDGGAKIITCADGTSITVANGMPGTSCTVGPKPDGGSGKVITCADGTSVTIENGDAGTSCTVGVNDAGIRVVSCGDGTSVPVSPDPLPPGNILSVTDELPGLVVKIAKLAGGSGPGGNFQIGDTVSVTFTIKTKAGNDLPLSAVDDAAVWISGPTTHYQRVLPAGRDQFSLNDVKTRAVRNADGSYTYAFPTALPAAYGPPLWDTGKFTDGELTGKALEHGTYTLALRLFRAYQVSVDTFRDVGSDNKDFLLGTATTLDVRDVVGASNCNQCHTTLQAHGGTYRDVKLCLTCHTAGAEDRNSADTGDATPVTIEFSTMMHKLHNGAHLPSVLGIGVNADGTRNYAVPAVPYAIGGRNATVDFSHVTFPVWPSLSFPTPRPRGFTTLAAAQQALDDANRSGVIACEKCHGDPDGAGPLAAPTQGEFAYAHQSRRACGSCHDDIDWAKPYKRNFDTGMPAQPNDSNCLVCHPATGFAVGGSPREGHRHPLADPTFNPGLKVTLGAVKEGPGANQNGKVDVGEKLQVTVNVTDDTGKAFAAASLPSLSVIVTGPTSNRNLVLTSTIPAAALAGAGPWTLNLPEVVNLEKVGTSTATTGDVFTVSRGMLWNVTGAVPSLWVRTGLGASTTLTGAGAALDNQVVVASSTGFARNDYLVIDDGVAGKEEYLRVQWVDGNRLWFAAAGASGYQPGLRFAHAAGATVTKATLAAKTLTTDFTVSTATGQLTEVTELGAGAVVLATYTTDFLMPSVYGPPLNDSPDLGAAAGKWKGMPIVPGTYTVGLWGSRTLSLALNGETNSYRSTSLPANLDFLVGTATKLAPAAIVATGAACESCHTDVYAHGGGRRGFDTCVLCHGNAGTEDRPRYVAANAPDTTGTTVELRTMLHKIHRGAELAGAETYQVVGFGAGAYPNNFTAIGFGEVEFPAMPSGVKDCRVCHGTSDAWQSPADRSHPTASAASARVWQSACGSCHDSHAATAHIDVMTSSVGGESCAICHDTGRELATTLVHKIR